MKYSFLIILSGIIFIGCKKSSTDSNSFSESRTIPVGFCTSFTNAGVNYSICLDSVVDESRCPIDALCIWAGVAKAKFTFTESGNAHHFYLYTPGYSSSFPSDTIINAVKIDFKSLTPRPALNIRYDYSAYRAEVQITK